MTAYHERPLKVGGSCDLVSSMTARGVGMIAHGSAWTCPRPVGRTARQGSTSISREILMQAARRQLEASERTQQLVGLLHPSTPGRRRGVCCPVIRQLFVGAGAHETASAGDGAAATAGGSRSEGLDQDAFERKLYVIRRVCEQAVATSEDVAKGFYVTSSSSSSRTLNYKGMLISHQLGAFYPDLRDERCKSALALVHSRFSTNPFPSWELAHPYRVICHNGEINTVMGNVNWMRARESQLASELFGEDLAKILPVVMQGNSDSATFDNVLELLMLAGRSLPHAVMMIPEAYRDRGDLPDELARIVLELQAESNSCAAFVGRFWGESH